MTTLRCLPSLLAAGILLLPLPSRAAGPAYQVRGQSILVNTKTSRLEIQVFTPGIVRVVRFPAGNTAAKKSLSVIKTPEAARFTVAASGEALTIKTARLQVRLSLKAGTLSFATLAGAPLLREAAPDSLYYFVYGQTPDGTGAGYRALTGAAPMFGKWAFGFWQSRERYKSQDELLDVVTKYRSLRVPLDNIVQDWQYWGTDNHYWNSTEFGNHGTGPPPGRATFKAAGRYCASNLQAA